MSKVYILYQLTKSSKMIKTENYIFKGHTLLIPLIKDLTNLHLVKSLDS